MAEGPEPPAQRCVVHRRRIAQPAYAPRIPVSSAHGHADPCRRRARRLPRPSRADRGGARPARGPAQPHPRPVREARRAGHGRHPAHGAGDRAREHPPRGRRGAVADARGGPGQRPAPRRRPVRRARRSSAATDARWPTSTHAHAPTRWRTRLPRRRHELARADGRPPRARPRHGPRASTPGSRSTTSGRWPRPTPPTPGSRRPAARDRPRSPPLHPLLGVPVALKDLVSVRGGQCTAGSRILEGYRSPFDAHITERLRDAGAVILGKTNMDEFAMGSSTEHSAFGPTSQPVGPGPRPRRVVAAAPRRASPRSTRRSSIGTDTGGSIRQPAALCGIVGIKPTYGRVSRYGIVAFASSLDQIGPFARDARDAAALLHAIAGPRRARLDQRPGARPGRPAPRCPASDDEAASWLRGKRFGLPQEYFVAGMEPGVEARVREAVAALEAAGATVEEVSLPHTDYGLATYYIVAPAEASSNLARYDGVRYGHSVLDAGDYIANELATRGERLRPRGQAPDHARDVRAVGRLLRRVLPQGAEGPDADQARLRHALGAGLRRPRRADLADASRSGSAPGWPTRSQMYLSDACTLPVNMAGPARDLDPVRAVGGAAGRPPADRRRLVRGRAVPRRAGLRGRHRRAPTGARSARTTWRASATRPLPTPAERFAAAAA